GKLLTDPRSRFLFCKIQVNGRRDSFPLRTANKSAAATKAAKIYGDVSALGWAAALAKHKPETVKHAKTATVGALIEAATRLSPARRESTDAYAKALRRITAAVIGLDSGRKFDCKRGSHEWRAKVDAVCLDQLTPARVQSWRNSFIKAERTPEERNHAIITMNSLIRNSKALLSKKILPFLTKEITLPAELWFHGITNEKEPSLRYKSKVDAVALMAAARLELADTQPEAFKLLLLTLVCGLRRSEADALLWSQFDFENGTITMEDTDFKRLKSQDSAGVIGLDAELVAMLRGYHARATGAFVLETPKLGRVAITKLKARGYRCEATQRVLIDWLRENGVPDLRPIHTMRKEIGSIIASRDGIFKASRYLRHSDIGITSKLYADVKTPVSAGLGALLTAHPANVVEADFTAEAARPARPKINRTLKHRSA
ncbi:MAG: tyrosine-type recombinase/integrase, partial [Verrucomicrobiota bacterium]|nr:tyrosine-type recombinase/integrase [Verrucomicrobiota bacterium]